MPMPHRLLDAASPAETDRAARFLALVAEPLAATDRLFRERLGSDVPFIHHAGEYIFDASLIHLRNEHGLDVPDVVLGERFKISSHVVARQNLSNGARLWWHDAPAVLQRHPHLEDIGLVKDLARPVIDFLEQIYASDLEATFLGEGRVAASLA